MNIRSRKALGCLLLLACLAIYIVLAAALGGWLNTRAPAWALLGFYVLAGVAWVAPLRPLLRWMAPTTSAGS